MYCILPVHTCDMQHLVYASCTHDMQFDGGLDVSYLISVYYVINNLFFITVFQ